MQEQLNQNYPALRYQAVRIQMIRCAKRVDMADFIKHGEHWYSLFDYYDAMIVKLEDHLQPNAGFLRYTDCIAQDGLGATSIQQNLHVAASSYTTLVRYTQDIHKQESDLAQINPVHIQYHGLFNGGTPANDTYSEMPFLGVINLTLKPHCLDSTMRDVSPNGIEEFLRQCINEIEKKTEQVMAEYANIQYQAAAFITMDMGHFALVVRSDSPKAAYIISRAICTHNAFDDISNIALKKLSFQAYVNQGMEMAFSYNAIAGKTLRPKTLVSPRRLFQDDHDIVILRSGHPSVSEVLGLDACEDIHWICGRYQHSIRIPVSRFEQSLPRLWEYKFDVGGAEYINGATRFPLPFIEPRGIINDRIMLDVDSDIDEKHPISLHEQKNGILQLIQLIQDKLQSLLHHEYILPFGRAVFMENCFLLREVIATCASIFNFSESHYNGTMLYMLLFLVLDALNPYLEVQEALAISAKDRLTDCDKVSREALCNDLLNSLVGSVEDIVSFMKIIQSQNIQTFQSPHYEIQPSIDGEKYVLAYQEFIRRFALDWVVHRDCQMITPIIQKKDGLQREVPKKYFFPYISIEHHYRCPRASVRFPPLEDASHTTSAIGNIVLLSIATPNFRYFARPYDLVPLALHEISHHIRFMDRAERNQAYVKMVFERISVVIIVEWPFTDSDRSQIELIPSFRQFMQKAFADTMYTAFETSILDNNDDSNGRKRIFVTHEEFWQQSSLNQINENLSWFLYSYVFNEGVKPSPILNRYDSRTKTIFDNLINDFCNYTRIYSNQSDTQCFRKKRNEKQFDLRTAITQAFDSDNFELYLDLLENKVELQINRMVLHEVRSLYPLFLRKPPQASNKSNSVMYELRNAIGWEILSYVKSKKGELLHHTAMQISDLLDSKQLELLVHKFRNSESSESYQYILETLIKAYSDTWDGILDDGKQPELKNLIDKAINEIKNACKRIIDLRFLYDQMRVIGSNCISKKSECLDYHAQFANMVSISIIDTVEQFKNRDDSSLTWDVLSDQGILNRYNLLDISPVHLSNRILRTLSQIPCAVSKEAFKSSRDFYDEVCADLGMCSAISLSSFGYLRFFLRFKDRVDENSWLLDSMNVEIERMTAVITILLSKENESRNDTCEYNHQGMMYISAHALIDELLDFLPIVQATTVRNFAINMCNANQTAIDMFEKVLDKRCEKISLCLNMMLQLKSNMKSIDIPFEMQSIIDEYRIYFKDVFHVEPDIQNLPGQYLQEWRYLLESVNFLQRWGFVSPQNAVKPKPNSSSFYSLRIPSHQLEHFSKLYNVIGKMDYPILSQDDLRKKIGRYYNQHIVVINGIAERRMLDSTFDFILCYYYSYIYSIPSFSEKSCGPGIDHADDNESNLEKDLRRKIASYVSCRKDV